MTTTDEVAFVRAAWGLVLLAAPVSLTGDRAQPPEARHRGLFRMLGARHLLQAAVTARRPNPVILAAGAVTDMLHATSMAALAVGEARWRGRAGADAVLAACFAAAGAHQAHTTLKVSQPGSLP